MSDVKAFVGHSFSEDDRQIVQAFLKMLDQIASLHPSFSWQHAESAEPRLLTEKVLTLIEGKNLFIGICTRKEFACSPSAIASVPFLNRKRMLNFNQLEWKTSDWVIQEIGLAAGKNLSLVLLIEDGVRKPGGLQGDVEYIPFDREKPEKAFGKLLEMISALSPKSSAVSASLPASQNVEVEDASLKVGDDDESWKYPDEHWTEDKYRGSLIFARASAEREAADRILAAYRTFHVGQNDAIANFEALDELYKIFGGGGGSLARLKSLADASPHLPEITKSYARGLRHFDMHKEAASEFESAATNASSPKQQVALLGSAAREYNAANLPEKVRTLHSEIRRLRVGKNVDEIDVLKALAAKDDPESPNDYSLAVQERLLALTPSDHDKRFALAYAYARTDHDGLALYHYRKIPYGDRNAMAWNNLGVSYDKHEMPGFAVHAFRKAEELGETLAMANLGHKYLSVGMFQEAKDICKKAMEVENFHNNVTHLLAQIKDAPDAESARRDEADRIVSTKRPFIESFGRATILETPKQYFGRWQSQDAQLELRINDRDEFVLSGTYEREVTSLSIAFGASPRQKMQYSIRYEGSFVGRACVASMSRRVDNLASLASAGADKVLMYISDDGSEIHVMENPSAVQPQTYRLTAVLQLAPPKNQSGISE